MYLQGMERSSKSEEMVTIGDLQRPTPESMQGCASATH
jgi:hypothetical protein